MSKQIDDMEMQQVKNTRKILGIFFLFLIGIIGVIGFLEYEFPLTKKEIEKQKQENIERAKYFLKEGIISYNREKFEEALSTLETAWKLNETGETASYLCSTYIEIDKYIEAIPWCEKGVNLGDNNSIRGLGVAYAVLKDYEKSLYWLKQAYEKKVPKTALNIGFVYFSKEDYKEAEKWYLEQIKIDPEEGGAYSKLGTLYYEYLKDNVKASAYAIALINTKFQILSVADLLILDWKIPFEDIKKGYELQLNSPDFPIKYINPKTQLIDEKSYYEFIERRSKRHSKQN